MKTLIGYFSRFCFLIAAGGLLLVSALSCFAAHSFAGDRCGHFTFYWAVLALVLVAWSWRRRSWGVLLMALLLAALHGIQVSRLWKADPVPVSILGQPAEITVVCANLYLGNLRKAEGLGEMLQLNPDILILMEVANGWRETLQPLLEKYPHRMEGAGDLWLLSRFPLKDQEEISLTLEYVSGLPGQVPWDSTRPWAVNSLLRADIEVGGKRLRLVALHPPVPLDAIRLAQQFHQVNAYVAALEDDSPTAGPAGPAGPSAQILIGDFNTTPFSAVMKRISEATGLRDAAAGDGYRVTWGPRLPREPLFPWFGIPLDHALVSSPVKVLHVDAGETPGADHKWQRVKLQF